MILQPTEEGEEKSHMCPRKTAKGKEFLRKGTGKGKNSGEIWGTEQHAVKTKFAKTETRRRNKNEKQGIIVLPGNSGSGSRQTKTIMGGVYSNGLGRGEEKL